jgi:hypothetical protein
MAIAVGRARMRTQQLARARSVRWSAAREPEGRTPLPATASPRAHARSPASRGAMVTLAAPSHDLSPLLPRQTHTQTGSISTAELGTVMRSESSAKSANPSRRRRLPTPANKNLTTPSPPPLPPHKKTRPGPEPHAGGAAGHDRGGGRGRQRLSCCLGFAAHPHTLAVSPRPAASPQGPVAHTHPLLPTHTHTTNALLHAPLQQ